MATLTPRLSNARMEAANTTTGLIARRAYSFANARSVPGTCDPSVARTALAGVLATLLSATSSRHRRAPSGR